MKSIASAIWAAERVVVPWSSRADVSIASPSFPFGSWAAPARMSMRADTTGCSFWLTSTTWRPLGRVWIS